MYVVEIEVDEGEYDLIRVSNGWNINTPVKFFNTKQEAEEEASKWATGKVVPYIRSFGDDERQRAKEKSIANGRW